MIYFNSIIKIEHNQYGENVKNITIILITIIRSRYL